MIKQIYKILVVVILAGFASEANGMVRALARNLTKQNIVAGAKALKVFVQSNKYKVGAGALVVSGAAFYLKRRSLRVARVKAFVAAKKRAEDAQKKAEAEEHARVRQLIAQAKTLPEKIEVEPRFIKNGWAENNMQMPAVFEQVVQLLKLDEEDEIQKPIYINVGAIVDIFEGSAFAAAPLSARLEFRKAAQRYIQSLEDICASLEKISSDIKKITTAPVQDIFNEALVDACGKHELGVLLGSNAGIFEALMAASRSVQDVVFV